MDLGLRGRVAVVGGASRGLGRACAEALADEGARVVVCSREQQTLEQTAREIERRSEVDVVPIVCDQTSAEDIDCLIERVLSLFGRIDVLVNNTGGPPPGLFLDHDDGDWQAAFEGLVLSVVRLCRGVLPIMRERGWGRIVTNTSFTVKEPAERLVLSNALRAAVVALSKTISREVAGDGITVNCVCPGAFDTDRLRALFDEQADASGRSAGEVRAQWEARIPIGRVSRPEELAALVTFLASEQAASITGGCFPVDGGLLRSLF